MKIKVKVGRSRSKDRNRWERAGASRASNMKASALR